MSVVRNCLVLLLATALPVGAQQDAPHEDGEQIFSLVCAMCHSVNPPAKAAPPISHAAAYYSRRHDGREAAVLAMVAFLKEPAAERSVLPPHAVERFGLMPPQAHLSDAQLRAVAQYALSVADTVHVGPGHRHGAGTP
jgi:cytochrome c